jgi:rod shape-determining protein MreC
MAAKSSKPLIATVACCTVGVALSLSPSTVTMPVRATVRDIARPGQHAASMLVDRSLFCLKSLQDAAEREDGRLKLEHQLNAWKHRYRRLQIEQALLHEELKRQSTQSPNFQAVASGQPLIIPELVEAVVLGEESAALWRSGKLLGRGADDGIEESALVLEDVKPLVDQGEDAELAKDQPVYSGRCVVGKIAQVGRWTSTVSLVTDPAYRGLARLGRETPDGLVFGAEGIIAGQNDALCRLEYVSSTESVEVGDDVFTGESDGAVPYPMYYGKVVRAELKAGAPRWDIWVRPAVLDLELKTVQILKRTLNPVRVLAQ